jgi:hypothetical protein
VNYFGRVPIEPNDIGAIDATGPGQTNAQGVIYRRVRRAVVEKTVIRTRRVFIIPNDITARDALGPSAIRAQRIVQRRECERLGSNRTSPKTNGKDRKQTESLHLSAFPRNAVTFPVDEESAFGGFTNPIVPHIGKYINNPSGVFVWGILFAHASMREPWA